MKSSLNAIFSVSAWSDAMDQAVNTPLVLWANLLRIIFSRSNLAATDWTQTEDIRISYVRSSAEVNYQTFVCQYRLAGHAYCSRNQYTCS